MTGSNQVSNVVSSVVTPVALSGVKTPLLNQFEGAAAAYSLRRLKSWDDGSRVVRVRRESDNTERDFSSVEVSDGTMARWVNEQPTLPLDLRELDANTGERDGALIEAAAAYSLRKLKEDFTGDVVEVRRNVDGETEGFTADEVTDGTLESFVEAWELYTPSTKTLINEPYWDLIPTDNQNFQIISNNADSESASWRQVRLVNSQDLRVGKNLVTFDVTVNSGTLNTGFTTSSLSLYGRDGSLDGNTSDIKQLSEGFNSHILETVDNAFGQVPDIFFSSGPNSKFDVTISNLKVYKSTVNELPLDQATGAAAAYSLRNLSSSYTGDVVEVRRSSDDAEESFTASEVADGTLTDWVNTDIDKLDLQAESGGLIGNVSNETANSFDFSVNNEGTDGYKRFAPLSDIIESTTFQLTFDVTLSSGSLTGIQILSNGPNYVYTQVTEGANSISITNDSSALYQVVIKAAAAAVADVSITNITLTQTSANGHVKTWYDQSGSDNHAVQTDTAKQPKIVEGGSLVADGIDFDGTEHLDHATSLSQPFYLFANYQTSVDNSPVVGADASASAGATVSRRGTGEYIQYAGNSNSIGVHGDDKKIASALFDGANSEAHWNGTKILDGDVGTQTNMKRIGGNGSDGFTGKIGEIIIYNSDQSTKRRAIEENIANHYDISLAAFSRDGTVSTWYDQSGNTPANDATQTDPTKQPKIVEGGSLLKLNGKPSIDFSTVDGYLELSQEVDTSNKPCSIIAATEPTNKALIGQTSNRRLVFNSSDARFGLSVSAITEDYPSVSGGAVFTAIHNGTTTAPNVVIYANGSASTTNDSNQGSPMTVGVIDFIGVNLGSAVISYFDKKLPEVIIYNSDQTANRTAIEANIGETYGITDIPAANDTVNGFVQTWYDQSGNVPANDAVQDAAANQPKIVDAGSLVTDRDGKIAINGKGARLDLPANAPMLSSDGTYSLFAAVDFDDQRNGNDNFNNIFRFDSTTAGGASSARKPLVYLGQSDGGLSSTGPSFPSGSVNYTLAEALSVQLFTNIANPALSTGNHTAYADGNLVGSTNNATDVNTNTLLSTSSQIFDNQETTVTHFLSEVIYYPSDQSANRTAIETNIANQYGITIS